MQLTIASTVAQNNKIDKAKKSKITNKLSSNTACLWLDPLGPNHQLKNIWKTEKPRGFSAT